MRDTLIQLASFVAAVAFSTGYAAVDTAQDFMNRAAVSDRFELSLADLAKERGDDASRAFAARIRRDHQESQRELQRIAAQEKLAVPEQLDARHSALLAELRELDGKAFDRAFARAQVDAHREAVALYEAEANDGPSSSLRDFAERVLPRLRDHLARARTLYE
jgi:putative membrane protein